MNFETARSSNLQKILKKHLVTVAAVRANVDNRIMRNATLVILLIRGDRNSELNIAKIQTNFKICEIADKNNTKAELDRFGQIGCYSGNWNVAII